MSDGSPPRQHMPCSHPCLTYVLEVRERGSHDDQSRIADAILVLTGFCLAGLCISC